MKSSLTLVWADTKLALMRVVLLGRVHMQESVDGFDPYPPRINFFWQEVDGYSFWSVFRTGVTVCTATKDNQAMGRQAEDRSHFWIAGTLDNEAKC